MGLAARFIEENGLSTVVLNPTWEFNRGVGVPRTAAIEYPYGRPVGDVGDIKNQRDILQQTLDVLVEADSPGFIRHLPHVWHQEPKETKWQPPEISPVIKMYLDDIKKM